MNHSEMRQWVMNLNNKRKPKAKEEMTKKLIATAGICKHGPKDLADNHAFYLYGAKK